MVLTFAGAAELYLNGKLIYHFGKISKDFKEERTCLFFNRPFSLTLGNQNIQELVIKYALHPKNLYINFGDHPLMSVVLKDINPAFTDYIQLQGGYHYLLP